MFFIYIFLIIFGLFLFVYSLISILNKYKIKKPKNELLEKRKEVVSSWKNLLSFLKKRDDALGLLVNSLENVDLKEKNVLADLLRVRSELKYAENFTTVLNVYSKTNNTLKNTFLILEKYEKVLESNQKYQHTKKHMSSCDKNITDAIAKYNNSVNTYNFVLSKEEHRDLALKLNYKKKELFSLD